LRMKPSEQIFLVGGSSLLHLSSKCSSPDFDIGHTLALTGTWLDMIHALQR
jgi:hypothetical protein